MPLVILVASYAAVWLWLRTVLPLLLIVVHELGHALPALALGRAPVVMDIGRGADVRAWQFRRLTVTLRRDLPRRGILGHRLFNGDTRIWLAGHTLSTRPKRDAVLVVIILGGPLASAACGSALLWLACMSGHVLWTQLHADLLLRPAGWGWAFLALWPWPFVTLLSGVASMLYALLNLTPRGATGASDSLDPTTSERGRPSDGLLLRLIIQRSFAQRRGQTAPAPVSALTPAPVSALTPALRAALGAAALAASRCGASEIGDAHLLLGIIHDREGAPARLLAALGATVEDIDAAIQARGVVVVPESARPAPSTIGLAPDAKETVGCAWDEACRLGRRQVSPEAVLLALARHSTSAAGQALHELGLSDESIREQLGLLRVAHGEV